MTVPKHSRGPRRWLLWVAVGTALVVGGVVGGLIFGATQPSSSAADSHSPAASTSSTTVSACPVTSVADRVIPSVVTIAASGPGGSGTGSGEVIRADGYVLTNNHVISVAAASGGPVEVLFADGQHAAATITGRDPQTDLAVLKVQTSRQLKVIELGSSSSVKVGQPVVAIGAPLGLSGTVTSGIVSALDRTVGVPGENDRSALLVSAVQTDASINPGNSGGALVNCEGQLVGVPTAGAAVPNSGGGSIGLGFAIPVDLAKRIADEIISTPRVRMTGRVQRITTARKGIPVLYAFGFERVGVVVGDLYFVDPSPREGQEGAEHGVRLELRVLGRGELRGTVYSAQPIEVGQPIWRADLLESVAGRPGSFDRTHHHPRFTGWNPGRRVFTEELSADPLGWLGTQLSDLDALLASAGTAADVAGASDAEDLRRAVPEIVDATRRLLDKVRSGELGNPPDGAAAAGGTQPAGATAGGPAPSRVGWL